MRRKFYKVKWMKIIMEIISLAKWTQDSFWKCHFEMRYLMFQKGKVKYDVNKLTYPLNNTETALLLKVFELVWAVNAIKGLCMQIEWWKFSVPAQISSMLIKKKKKQRSIQSLTLAFSGNNFRIPENLSFKESGHKYMLFSFKNLTS